MEVIVINRPLQKEEELALLEQLNSGNKKIELYSNFPWSEKLAGFSGGLIELRPDEKKTINYEIFDQVLKFGEIKIGETAITDLLMFEKASIWHYHKFRTYFFIRNLTFEIRLIEKLSQEYQRITYYGESAFLKNYPFNYPGLTILIPDAKKSKVNYRTLFNYLIFFKLRVIAGFIQLIRYKKAKHIVIDHAIRQTLLNLFTLKPEPGNYNLEYLFEKLDHDFLILDEVDFPKFQKGSDFKLKKWQFFTKGRRLFCEIILLKGLLSRSVRKQLKSFDTQLKRKYQPIKSSLTNPIDLITLDFLESLHSSSKLFLFKYLAYKNFFSRHRFKSISSIDENSLRIKSIFDAAKTFGIKTIGIQHGTIHDLHPAYMFTEKDAERKLVPDYTLIWGENWKKLLSEKGKYNPSSLIITGQIRTDIIPILEKHKHQLELKEKYPYKKLILYASQFQRDLVLREKAAIDLFQIVKHNPKCILIIKLHPSEKDEIDYYKSLAQKAECENFEIKYYADLYFLISQCDIITTCFSTVGTEAIYFNKPLIIIDYLRQDIQNYHKTGVAFQATNQDELKFYLESVFTGQNIIDPHKYKKFIQDYSFKIDGKTAERCITFIKSLEKNNSL
jgi:hypothetical protein